MIAHTSCPGVSPFQFVGDMSNKQWYRVAKCPELCKQRRFYHAFVLLRAECFISVALVLFRCPLNLILNQKNSPMYPRQKSAKPVFISFVFDCPETRCQGSARRNRHQKIKPRLPVAAKAGSLDRNESPKTVPASKSPAAEDTTPKRRCLCKQEETWPSAQNP